MERETSLQGRHQNVEGPVLDPCAKQIYFRRAKRGSKVVPPGGSVWSLHFVRCAEALQAAMCAKCQASLLRRYSH